MTLANTVTRDGRCSDLLRRLVTHSAGDGAQIPLSLRAHANLTAGGTLPRIKSTPAAASRLRRPVH